MSRDRTARTRIRQFLSTSGPVVDPSGYATSVLKDAIGYTGSSVAFIQLIAAMDREGELTREIRGKRTYRIEGIGVPPTPSAGAIAPVVPAAEAVPVAAPAATVSVPGQGAIEIDYRKLAQALVRELLTATAVARAVPAASAAASSADQIAVERDEYLRRLETARSKLDELLGEPLGELLDGGDAVARR